MNITSAQWADAAHTSIVAVVDDTTVVVPTDKGNRHYAAVLVWATTNTIAPSIAETLDGVKAAKITALYAACSDEITTGYQSDALGAVHNYPADALSQINMLGSVLASNLPDITAGWATLFMCGNATGLWMLRPHTARQIQAAGQAGKLAVVTAQSKLQALVAKVTVAKDTATVSALTW